MILKVAYNIKMPLLFQNTVSFFKKINTFIVDLLFPPACVGCENFGPLLCDDCLKNIGAPIDTCIYCGNKTLHGATCNDCRKHYHLTGIVSVGGYKNPILRDAVHTLKFSGVRNMAIPLGDLLAKNLMQTLGNNINEFTLVPLPLHKKRQNERSFNQAELLAARVAELLSLPVKNILMRVKSTQPQASIDSKQKDLRLSNIAEAFAISPDYQEKIPAKIIIVDDVATSGATLEEAAKLLQQSGAKEIKGAVICRG